MNTEIHQFVLDKKGRRKGVVVAKLDPSDDAVYVGWSLTHKNDKFDKERGLLIAKNRAYVGSNSVIPQSIENDVLVMVKRAMKYFKNKQIHISSDMPENGRIVF